MKPPLDLAALLKPIAGRNLAGEDIRYSKLYQQIREARATDGLVESKIDWNLILKKSTEGLTEKSKDLQLAVWIVEALTQMDGFAGTANGLRLLRCLLEQYWDTLYPQIDPDDEEPLAFRLSIMEWVNTRLPGLLQSLPLTSGETNYSLAHWLVTQKTGAAKEGFLADGWPSSEQFTEALDKSPLAELEDLERDTKSCRDSLAELEQLADNLFVEKKALSTGDTQAVPLLGFRQLRETIENCFWVVERAAKKQRDLSGPSTAPEPAEAPAVIEATEGPDASEDSPRAAALPSVEKASREQTSPVQPPRPQPVTAAQPGDPSQATAQIFDLAALLRKDNPCRPIPYLLSRAVRWGHLLGFSDLKSAEPLSAPSSELRKKLRSLCQQEKWSDLLSEAETALSSEDTGAWLDLHRYTVVAMEKLGADYGPAALSVRGLLRVLLEVHPVLPEADLADGTPAAGVETQQWIREQVRSSTERPEEPIAPQPRAVFETREQPESAERPVDVVAEARRLARTDTLAALRLLQQEVASTFSGRDQFLRKLEMAELCLDTGRPQLAFPLLDELTNLIDQLGLEKWESRDLIARTWSGLVRCCRKLGDSQPKTKLRGEEIFSRLCRLDLTIALGIEAG